MDLHSDDDYSFAINNSKTTCSSGNSTAVLRSRSLSPLRGRALAKPAGDTTTATAASTAASSDKHSSDAVDTLKDKPIRPQSPLSPLWGGVGIGIGGSITTSGVHTRIHSHTGIANSSSSSGHVGVNAAADHRAGLGAHLRYVHTV